MSTLHEIAHCTDGTRKADVLFVHGLGGDPFTTWQHSQDVLDSWPYWLGEDFPRVGIWSLGYAASPTKWAWPLRWLPGGSRDSGHSMPLPDRAVQVLDSLVQSGFGNRPLLFICHSLGGLLTKQILRTASDSTDDRMKKVFLNTRAVLFLATPHTGAELASLFNSFRTIFATTVSIEDLRAHDAHLRELYNWYRKKAEASDIHTATYFESRKFGGLTIVNPSSANPGTGSDPVPLDEDHSSIAKPRKKDDQVCNAARRLLREHVLCSPPGSSSVTASGTSSTPTASSSATPHRPWKIPSSIKYFKGREPFLDLIHKTLSASGPAGQKRVAAITASAAVTAIHGLGGIGKTRVVVEYAHRFADEYNALLFVTADSPASLEANLAKLCQSDVLNLAEKEAKRTGGPGCRGPALAQGKSGVVPHL